MTRDLISTYKSGGIPVSVPIQPAPPPAENPETPAEPVEEQPAAENFVVQQQGPTPTPFPTATPPPTATPRPDGAVVHIVATGDTLISIAIAYDIELPTLYELNGLGPNSLLSIGQEIILGYDREITSGTATAEAIAAPATATPSVLDNYPNTTVRDSDGAILYAVQEGNTLIEIALIYDLTLEEIYGFNDLNENSLISVGQQIVVGFVPTPEPSDIGGSADLPQDPPTATSTPPPTNTPAPTAIPPTETAVPTAEPSPTPAVTATPLPESQTAGVASAVSNMFLIGLFVAVAILALIGLLLVYLSRRA